MSIIFNGKSHDKVYFNGKYHDKLYHGSTLVWEKNTTPAETNLFVLNGGYDLPLYYLSKGLWYSTGSQTHTAVMPCSPNTSYVITIFARDRVKIASFPAIPPYPYSIYAGAYYDAPIADGYNATYTYTYTTGASDTYLCIYYWKGTTTGTYTDTLATLNIVKA